MKSLAKRGSLKGGVMFAVLVIVALLMISRDAWTPPEAAAPYLNEIHKAEDDYSLPHNMLARVLYQESRYRDDIIRGLTISHAGAMGIAQIVPRWHPNVDPLDPYQSIRYAAGYLSTLYKQFGTWDKALAAYNWGPGNVDRHGLENAPTETQNYIKEILADVPA